jgi:hypothetical protein
VPPGCGGHRLADLLGLPDAPRLDATGYRTAIGT